MINDIKKVIFATGGLLLALLLVLLKGIAIGKDKVKNNINKARVKDYERINKIKSSNSKLNRNQLISWLSKFQSK